MIRDLELLTARSFDVVVVGGGVYGLTMAYDATQRGLSVALVERDDFGSGASFNHLRTIHGGLRYLQSFDLSRARESVRERRTIARIAPHAVRPLPFALPLYRSLTRGKLAMRAGFLLDRLVAAGRNRGVPRSHRLRAGRVYSRSSAIQQFPGLKRQGLTGAAVWQDYLMIEPDRLTFAWAQAAAGHGAVLANHVEAIEVVRDGANVAGVRAKDTLGRRDFDIRARVVVNATGAAIDRLLAPIGCASKIPMIKPMNLVTTRDAGDEALGGRGPTGRNLFMVPWRERALFGTWESRQLCQPDDTDITEREVADFMGELNHAFPALDLSFKDITLVHRGIVPAAVHGNDVRLEGHDQIRDHAADGAAGLITVAGVKYTTARAVAERVTDRLMSKLGREPVACRTATTILPGGGVRDVGLAIAEARRDHDQGLPTDTIPHLIAAYGSQYRDVLDLADGRPGLKSRVAAGSPVIGAELVKAAKNEMAITLADVLIRRTPVGALGYPGDEAVARGADLLAAECGWSVERKRSEIDAVKSFYSQPTGP
ncbi:MAG TPA: glycerol-3-phosphate dehydrogenase/oxidase [Vicinamibacterales bacterium]